MIMPTISIQDVKKAFDALELAPTIDKKSIKKTSLNLLKAVHPDRTGSTATVESESRVRAINEAREILLNTLSDEQLLNFVSQLNLNPLNYPASAVSPRSNQSRDRGLDNSINIPSVIRIIRRPEPESCIKELNLGSNVPFLSRFFGRATPPVKSPTMPSLAVTALFIGNRNSGKMEFFEHAFKNEDWRMGDFKIVIHDKAKYQVFCMDEKERANVLTQHYYDKANMMAFFGDYSTVVDWISKTQERLTHPTQQQEEQPELYYVSYMNGTLNLHPWGEITEDEFNHNQTRQKIPSEHIHQFMNQFYNKITNMMLSSNTLSNHDRIQGGPEATR